jgi:hypothetical protein
MYGEDQESTVDARDVLDANARIKRGFVGRVRGHYRRIGPNAWDDYVYVERSDAEPIDVYPGIRVQLERSGCRFRMRSEGQVLVVSWHPDPERDGEQFVDTEARRAHFVARYLDDFDEKPGYGAAAVIASKLK